MKGDQGEAFQNRKARKNNSPIVNTSTSHIISALGTKWCFEYDKLFIYGTNHTIDY
jgi:hypothetical protein